MLNIILLFFFILISFFYRKCGSDYCCLGFKVYVNWLVRDFMLVVRIIGKINCWGNNG